MDNIKHADHPFGHTCSETSGHSVLGVVLSNTTSKWSQHESESSSHISWLLFYVLSLHLVLVFFHPWMGKTNSDRDENSQKKVTSKLLKNRRIGAAPKGRLGGN